MKNEKEPNKEDDKKAKKVDEEGNIHISEFLKITDLTENKVILTKRDV